MITSGKILVHISKFFVDFFIVAYKVVYNGTACELTLPSEELLCIRASNKEWFLVLLRKAKSNVKIYIFLR